MSSAMKAVTLAVLAVTMVVLCSAEPDHQQQAPKTDMSSRQTDAVARLNLGTAISLILPIALIVALVSFFMPIFQGLFAGPLPPFYSSPGPLTYASKKRSLFSGVTQENVMQVLDAVSKALDNFSSPDSKKFKQTQ